MRARLVLFLLPLVLTGRAVLTGSYFGPLDIPYKAAPLASRAATLPDLQIRDGILSDVAIAFVPWAKAVREAVKTGHFPLLNRFMLSGDVLLGTMQAEVFHPSTLLGFLLPLATARTLGFAILFFLAGASAFLYFRDLEVAEAAALFGACAWAFSAFLVFWAGWNVSWAAAPFPLLLLGLRRLARGARGTGGTGGAGGGVAVTTTALALILFAGHPETLFHSVAVAGVVFLGDLVHSSFRGRAVARAVAAGVLALGLGAVALLPFLDATSQSFDFGVRRLWYAHKKKSLPAAESLRSAVGAVYPASQGPLWESAPGEPAGAREVKLAFLGGLPLVLALVGLRTRRREKWLYLSVAAGCLLVASGFPGITDFVSRLPLFDVALNVRLAGFAAFFGIGLAVFGLERLLERRDALDLRLLAIGTAALLAGGVWELLAAPRPPEELAAFLRSLLYLVLPGLLFLAWRSRARRHPEGVASLAVALFLVFHLAEMPRLYGTYPADLFYPPVPEFNALPRGGEPYRTTGIGYVLIPNQSALYELEDPRGYTALTFERYRETYSLWSEPMPTWFNRVDDPPRPFVSLLNVRYAVRAPGDPTPGDWRPVVAGSHCAIFENPHVLPRAFAPARIRFVRDRQHTVREMQSCTDFSRLAWIEDPLAPPGERENGRAEIVTRRVGTTLELAIRAASPTWVVVSQAAWRGWRAEMDGKLLPLRFADHAFLGFEVPGGAHRVTLTYWPVAFTVGLAVSLTTLAVLLLLGFRARLTPSSHRS